jgi:hypothetical protein
MPGDLLTVQAISKALIRLAVFIVRSLMDFGTRQFMAGLIWCLFCAWLNSVSQIYVDKIHWAHFKEEGYKPLPDIGFILLPRLYISRLPDVWNAVIVLGTLLPIIFFHPSRVKIIRRYAAIQGTCFLLRSITIMVTILPNPYDTCVNTSRDDEVPFLEAFRVMLGTRITCGDVLYSGHAANFTLMALIWQEYGRGFFISTSGARRSSLQPEEVLDVSFGVNFHDVDIQSNSKEWYTGVLFPRLFWIVAAVGYLIIIACRFHYTVDVVVAIVVVAKQWGLYHMIIRTPKLIEKVPFLQWYECKGIYGPPQQLNEEEGSELGHFDSKSMASASFDFSPTPFGVTSPTARAVAPNDFGLEEGISMLNRGEPFS